MSKGTERVEVVKGENGKTRTDLPGGRTLLAADGKFVVEIRVVTEALDGLFHNKLQTPFDDCEPRDQARH